MFDPEGVERYCQFRSQSAGSMTIGWKLESILSLRVRAIESVLKGFWYSIEAIYNSFRISESGVTDENHIEGNP